MSTKLFPILAAATLLGSTGCATTVRSLTATSWIAPSSAAAASAPGAEGAAPAGGGIQSQFYVTYWEGSCKMLFGCGRGDTHVKRCKVNADNSVTCVEEENATKAFNPG